MMFGNAVFAYVGPETILPIVSAFTAILGAIMICWRWIFALVKKGFRIIFNRPLEEDMGEPMEDDHIDV